MKTAQLTRIEKMNIRNYLLDLKEQKELAQKEENMSLEIDTVNMMIGAKNILRLLGLEDLTI